MFLLHMGLLLIIEIVLGSVDFKISNLENIIIK